MRRRERADWPRCGGNGDGDRERIAGDAGLDRHLPRLDERTEVAPPYSRSQRRHVLMAAVWWWASCAGEWLAWRPTGQARRAAQLVAQTRSVNRSVKQACMSVPDGETAPAGQAEMHGWSSQDRHGEEA